MKQILVTVAAIAILTSCNSGGKGEKVSLKTPKDSFSYAFGVIFGKTLKSNNVADIDWDKFKAATNFVIKNGDTSAQMSQEVIEAFMNRYISEKKYGVNKTKGAEFIAKIKKDGGYTETKSGLLYKMVEKGTGVMPNPTDTLMITYTGKLIDGQTFDSNEDSEPMKIVMNNSFTIPGFTEAIKLLSVGGKINVIIPYHLAYGTTGTQGIEPYSTLIFDIYLKDIKK